MAVGKGARGHQSGMGRDGGTQLGNGVGDGKDMVAEVSGKERIGFRVNEAANQLDKGLAKDGVD